MVKFEIFEFLDLCFCMVVKLVEMVDDVFCKLIDDMIEIMYEVLGIGLVVFQVNVYKWVLVIDVLEICDQLQVFINLEIMFFIEDLVFYEEGCLLVFGFYEKVECFLWVCINVLDCDGELFEIEIDGLLVICIQYEIDYFNGKFFVDYVFCLKCDWIKKKFQKVYC